MPENYQGTAIDPEVFGQLDADTEEDEVIEEGDIDDDNDIEEEIEVEPESTPEQDNDVEPEQVSQSSFHVEGIGTVTAEQIKEWRNSGLRQSDYTRKTQELAEQRAKLTDAERVYDYLKAHPYITETIKAAEQNPQFNQIAPSAERDAIRGLQYQVQSMRVDSELKQLHEKYGDFDEDELFKNATESGVNDLEMVLRSTLYDANKVDYSAIEEAKKQLKEELEKERDTVSTVVTSKSSKKSKAPRLSNEEKHVAQMMGLTPREYAKWKNT